MFSRFFSSFHKDGPHFGPMLGIFVAFEPAHGQKEGAVLHGPSFLRNQAAGPPSIRPMGWEYSLFPVSITWPWTVTEMLSFS